MENAVVTRITYYGRICARNENGNVNFCQLAAIRAGKERAACRSQATACILQASSLQHGTNSASIRITAVSAAGTGTLEKGLGAMHPRSPMKGVVPVGMLGPFPGSEGHTQ